MDYGLLTNVFNSTNLGFQIVPVILGLISVLAITRDTRKMRMLAFPMLLGYSRIGLQIPNWALIVSAITMAVTIVGVHTIGSTLSSIPNMIEQTYKQTTGYARRNREQRLMGAMQQAAFSDSVDVLTQPLQRDKKLRSIREQDWIEKTTMPLSVRKGVRNKRKSELIRKIHEQQEFQEWLQKQNPN